ncbi:prolyl oligopeptidase family serine peptidase [uncultured Ilumatobacter sp.]|uniref:S9 family peptidase n=1 Tax=uncultured Ilumatobacter sp. TaxID=879968 RepID=UPI00374E7B85
MTDADTFPRQHARTQRFTLGAPRDITVSADGERVVFLRSSSGTDPVNALWVFDVADGTERLVGDPRALLSEGSNDVLPPLERARRERAREGAGGITSYATDAAGKVASFALGGRMFVADLLTGLSRPLDVAGPVFDPRPDPTARRIAYASGRLLCIGELDGTWRVLAGGEPTEADTVSWGSADFIAAEEMHRFQGYWWSPDGDTIAACRVDTSPVDEWVIADPANPDRPAKTVRYPSAGTNNATVSLHLLGLNGSRTDVDWDHELFPYIASVEWTRAGLIMCVQARDQRGTMTLKVDKITGQTEVLAHDDDDAWVELVPGVPRLLPDGTLVSAADRDGARRLMVNDQPVTPDDLQVRAVLEADAESILFQANPIDDATSLHVWRRSHDGTLTALTDEPGIHTLAERGGTSATRSATLGEPGATHLVTHSSGAARTLESFAETPLVTPNVQFFRSDVTGLTSALLLPHDHDGSPLPVLLDPYGGPHALRVQNSFNAFVASQWFADQGFAVLVTDNRGTPGRGSVWERAVHGDLATAPLDDQIEALQYVARETAVLDRCRVAIRGWSFGGYLAALAVLRRPDVFHAAIAGAPVTEWRLYDTHYTERYLGDPNVSAGQYDASSLLPLAGDLKRPLLLIHGLADDNVVAAHTLRLSSALLTAGKPHEVLPLVGATHMATQEQVAENLLLHQLDFLRRSLPEPMK